MSWSEPVYGKFPDFATAKALAEQLGATFEDDSDTPNTTHGFAAVSPITQWIRWPGTDGPDDPGEAEAGYWTMARFELSNPAALAAYNAFKATPYYQQPATPSQTFFGA